MLVCAPHNTENTQHTLLSNLLCCIVIVPVSCIVLTLAFVCFYPIYRVEWERERASERDGMWKIERETRATCQFRGDFNSIRLNLFVSFSRFYGYYCFVWCTQNESQAQKHRLHFRCKSACVCTLNSLIRSSSWCSLGFTSIFSYFRAVI